MKKKKEELTIHSSTAEYLTYVASIGNQSDSIEMRYEVNISQSECHRYGV